MASIRSWLSLVMTSTGLIAVLAARHGRDVDVHAEPGPRSGLARRAGEPGAAEVLDADDEAGVEQGEAGLDEPLLFVGIADLNARPLVGVAVSPAPSPAEAGRGEHAHPADPVAARERPEQHGEIAFAGRRASTRRSIGQHAEAEHIDERIVSVTGVEA